MKVTKLFFAVGLASSLFVSCGSTKITVQDNSPLAVFSIIGNSQVPWEKDDHNDSNETYSDGLLSGIVNKLADGQNPEILTAVERLDYADECIHQILPEIAGIEILDKEIVVKSQAYSDLRASYYNALTSTQLSTDYKDLTTIGAKRARGTMNELGAKSALILKFTFQKKLLKGNRWNGEFVGLVSMKTKLLNEKGKEIFNKTYESQTTETIKISSHKYDKSAFVELLKPAIEGAVRQFAMEFIVSEGDSEDILE